VIVLDRLFDGLRAIGADRATTWKVVQRAALDSIPAIRWALIEALRSSGAFPEISDGITLSEVAVSLDYPRRTTERTLEDLVAHGVVDVQRKGSGNPTKWRISQWTAENYAAATFPEKSEDISPDEARTHTDDFSGKVGAAAGDNGNASPIAQQPLAAAVDAEEYAKRFKDEHGRGLRL
jgi:DNA-binding transcriptional ArsR family regulator